MNFNKQLKESNNYREEEEEQDSVVHLELLVLHLEVEQEGQLEDMVAVEQEMQDQKIQGIQVEGKALIDQDQVQDQFLAI